MEAAFFMTIITIYEKMYEVQVISHTLEIHNI